MDDQLTYRLLMSALLERLGVPHVTCANGAVALEAMAGGGVDLVISDCRMPVMDGYAMTRELRRREREAGLPRVPVMALTACLGGEEVRRCVECGMDGCLPKPVTLDQLREVFRYWLAPPHAPAPDHTTPLPRHPAPSRTSLIATFGSWAVVESLLSSLLLEAREDLAHLAHAEARQDTQLMGQCTHRLVGSMAFLGAAQFESQAAALMAQVARVGVPRSAPDLKNFRQEVERYLEYLSKL